jgi:hypothetical protein
MPTLGKIVSPYIIPEMSYPTGKGFYYPEMFDNYSRYFNFGL